MDPAGRHSGAKTVERGQTSFISLLYFALLFRSVQVHLPSCLAKWLASLLFGCGGGDSRSRRSRRRSVQSNLVDRKLTKERTAPRPDDDDKRQTKGRLGRWSKDDIKEQVDQIRRFTPRKKENKELKVRKKRVKTSTVIDRNCVTLISSSAAEVICTRTAAASTTSCCQTANCIKTTSHGGEQVK